MKKGKRAFSSNISLKNYLTKEQPNHSLDNNCLLNIKAQIINSKLVQGDKYNGDYIEYWIEIMTDYKKWIIKKRYSEFYDLNQILIQKIPELNKLFPPKRFFKNSESTIEERKNCFNKYLYYLFEKTNIFSLNEVMDFIQMDKKIIELYIKKHAMVKQDKDSNVFQSLKQSFCRMVILEKMDKSKSVGESLNINGISSISTKTNSKEEISKRTESNINNSIIESCDDTYDVEESNYYSTLLEYEKEKNIKENEDEDEKINFADDQKGRGTIVIDEFLKNLSQDIDNKTEILKAFEVFLKQGQQWPRFSKDDIIKLYVGNNNNGEMNKEKKWSFCLNELYSNKININSGTLNTIENEQNISDKKDNLINLENNNNIINNKDENEDSVEDYLILNGLFYYIGDFDTNILLSFSCLDLLVKLLDNEFNPEVEKYLKIFKTRKIRDYQTMKLNDIIKYNKGGVKATKNALKLLSILLKSNNKEIIKNSLIKDEVVHKQLEVFNS